VTETIYLEGKPAGKDGVAKIGSVAIGGALLGSFLAAAGERKSVVPSALPGVQ